MMDELTLKKYMSLDQEHLLHPYASLKNPPKVFHVAHARGTRLTLSDQRELIDGVSSWWSVCHGYGQEKICEAINRQLDNLPHVMFGGLTHSAAIELGEKILSLVDPSLTKIFFADSGSISVEVAIKMALQYQIGINQSSRNRLLTVKCGYHGDTLGTMALCDPEEGMHNFFGTVLSRYFFAPAPQCAFDGEWDEAEMTPLKTILEEHQSEIAAVIIEPILQGAGGMRIYHPNYLKSLRRLCDHYGILLIFDEIATGFGRTGKLFAQHHAGVTPDIMCIGKALSGGFMTLAATLCNEKTANGIGNGQYGALMHGPTFMANALACAAAGASLSLFEEYDWQGNIRNIEAQLRNELAEAKKIPHVNDVRVLGAVGVIEFDHDLNGAALQERFVEQGVWLRPFGKVIYTMPQFIITPPELNQITTAMLNVATEISQNKITPTHSFC